MENTVSTIKLTTLQSRSPNAVRPNTNEKIEDDGGRGVMRTKMILTEQLLLAVTVILLQKVSDAVFIPL